MSAPLVAGALHEMLAVVRSTAWSCSPLTLSGTSAVVLNGSVASLTRPAPSEFSAWMVSVYSVAGSTPAVIAAVQPLLHQSPPPAMAPGKSFCSYGEATPVSSIDSR